MGAGRDSATTLKRIRFAAARIFSAHPQAAEVVLRVAICFRLITGEFANSCALKSDSLAIFYPPCSKENEGYATILYDLRNEIPSAGGDSWPLRVPRYQTIRRPLILGSQFCVTAKKRYAERGRIVWNYRADNRDFPKYPTSPMRQFVCFPTYSIRQREQTLFGVFRALFRFFGGLFF